MNKFYLLMATGILVLCGAGCDSGSSTPRTQREGVTTYNQDAEEKTINRDDAISEHWDEIRDNLDGSEEIEACSSESGNCYDLDAEISSGQIEEIYFPSGGNLDFSAEISDDGTASDYDGDSNSWDFTLDMDSSIVDDAVQEWADDNGYQIE